MASAAHALSWLGRKSVLPGRSCAPPVGPIPVDVQVRADPPNLPVAPSIFSSERHTWKEYGGPEPPLRT